MASQGLHYMCIFKIFPNFQQSNPFNHRAAIVIILSMFYLFIYIALAAFSEEDEEVELFSWEDYLKKTCSKAVPKSSFKHVGIIWLFLTEN